jgi:predicted membrane channel-forming protein YqfA (hemolysin III family)
MWLVWIITGGRYRMLDWPFYIALGWGIVLFVHYIVVYRRFHKDKNRFKTN